MLASCTLVCLADDAGPHQQDQGFNATESMQHLQGILGSTAAQAAGKQSIEKTGFLMPLESSDDSIMRRHQRVYLYPSLPHS